MSPSIIHYNGDSISHTVNASLLVQVLRWVLKCLLSIDFSAGLYNCILCAKFIWINYSVLFLFSLFGMELDSLVYVCLNFSSWLPFSFISTCVRVLGTVA